MVNRRFKLWLGLWLAFCTRVNSIYSGNLQSRCKLLSRNKNLVSQQTGKDQVWIKPSKNFNFDKTQIFYLLRKPDSFFFYLFFILYNTTEAQHIFREVWGWSSTTIRTVLLLTRHCLILVWNSTVLQRIKTARAILEAAPEQACLAAVPWSGKSLLTLLECQIQQVFEKKMEKRIGTE